MFRKELQDLDEAITDLENQVEGLKMFYGIRSEPTPVRKKCGGLSKANQFRLLSVLTCGLGVLLIWALGL